jgi:MFS family permease
MSSEDSETEAYETKIPARMDRLPWSRWHWKIILALGVTWLLDGLEVTLVGALGAVLTQEETLGLTTGQIGLAASIYLLGAVLGAIVFGYLTDRYGRKKLFFITLSFYFFGVALTAFSIGFYTFALFRFITGLGIGGEYAAIYSAIDELIPARLRGHADLAISGSYWLGAALASIVSYFILTAGVLTAGVTWRLAFATGAILALILLYLRRFVPESPRWLMIHQEKDTAEEVVEDIEESVKEDTGEDLEEPDDDESITIEARGATPIREILSTMFRDNTQRSFLGFSLFVAQAFLYNAVFFTYALVLETYYGVPPDVTPIYLLPFAIANFVGAVLLGRFFDTIGRRPMISGTFGFSGILLLITGFLFWQGFLTAATQTLLWCVIFFFASPAASSAYLTVSEIFPLETRAMAIAVFYSIGTLTGGVVGPAVFGQLIGTGSRQLLFYGYAFAAILMIVVAGIEWVIGVNAEQKSLENISSPLSSSD